MMLKSRGAQAMAIGVTAGITAVVLNHTSLSVWWQAAIMAIVVGLVVSAAQWLGRR
ncbi:hypothetical protein [Lacticaseibacillus brantae]|uniref:hypothetical protein n=1 Tax=Lacticaseibacillus brantae TaxID=943673 RepID=UPI000A953A5D|nr:hypothetical protein [Lacticaseibacillus brantae]